MTEILCDSSLCLNRDDNLLQNSECAEIAKCNAKDIKIMHDEGQPEEHGHCCNFQSIFNADFEKKYPEKTAKIKAAFGDDAFKVNEGGR